MYRILIADDEGIVINSLKYIIEKNFEECVVRSAKTGRTVIELAESFRPDIAFMDIHMGVINGIDAIKEIKKFCNSTIFIVVTAYDRFDYARESVNLGVLEYINKPIEQEKIVKTLRRAMDLIDEEREKRNRDLVVREKLETVRPIIETSFLNEILFQEYYESDVTNFKTLLGIEKDHAYMMALIFGDWQEGNYMTNAIGATVRSQSRYSEIKEMIGTYFGGIVGNMMSNKIPVYMASDTEKMDYHTRINVIEGARNLVNVLENRFDIKFRIGIGSVYPMSEVERSYNEALGALMHSTAQVAHVKDLPIGCEYEESYPVDLEKELFLSVEQGDVIQCKESTISFFDWMESKYADQMEDIKLKVLEFVLWAEHIAYESGGMTYRFMSRSDYLPSINKIYEKDQLKNWFVDKMIRACKNITVKKKERSTSMVEKAKKYINENYMRDISLDDVSMELDISPYYFSKLFKEEAGENFTQYLTAIRINKAKHLLLETELSIREICNEVGYQDPNYFSRLFKKNVRLTPTEYKEGHFNETKKMLP